MEWYQVGRRDDQKCDLFEPWFRSPSNKKDKKSFKEKSSLNEKVISATPVESKLIGYYDIKNNQEEKLKVFDEYSKNQQIFLILENPGSEQKIILTRDKNNFEQSTDNIYWIGTWYKDNEYIWDSTDEQLEANTWLISHINYYSLVKIYNGEYDINKLI